MGRTWAYTMRKYRTVRRDNKKSNIISTTSRLGIEEVIWVRYWDNSRRIDSNESACNRQEKEPQNGKKGSMYMTKRETGLDHCRLRPTTRPTFFMRLVFLTMSGDPELVALADSK